MYDIQYIMMGIFPGTDLSKAQSDAIELSVKHKSNVRFKFNDSLYGVDYEKLIRNCVLVEDDSH